MGTSSRGEARLAEGGRGDRNCFVRRAIGGEPTTVLVSAVSGNPLPRGVSVLPFPLSPFPPRPEAPLAAAPAHATMVKHRRGRPVFVVLGTGRRGRQWQGRSSS